MMTYSRKTFGLLAAAVGTFAAADVQANHILGYDFNETGTVAQPNGTGTDKPVANIVGAGASRGGPGSGVSGLDFDRAFDNSGPSSIIGGGRAQNPGDYDQIDGLTSFTVAGWFRLPEDADSIGAQAGLVNNITTQVNRPTGGFGVTGGTVRDSGTLRLLVNAQTPNVESDPGTYDEVGEYVNFAVTYDGTTGAVQFYKGLTDEAISLVDTATLNAGAVRDENEPLTIGVNTFGSSLTSSGFNGLIDNVRIWDFVVSADTLETVRQGDVIPEPASLAVIAFGGLMLRRRR